MEIWNELYRSYGAWNRSQQLNAHAHVHTDTRTYTHKHTQTQQQEILYTWKINHKEHTRGRPKKGVELKGESCRQKKGWTKKWEDGRQDG